MKSHLQTTLIPMQTGEPEYNHLRLTTRTPPRGTVTGKKTLCMNWRGGQENGMERGNWWEWGIKVGLWLCSCQACPGRRSNMARNADSHGLVLVGRLPTIYGMQKGPVAYVGAVVSLKGSRHPNRAMGPLLGPQVDLL
jgi:hypothetical protein